MYALKEGANMAASFSLVLLLALFSNVRSDCNCSSYEDVSQEAFVFETRVLPDEACCMPTVGNGYLATVLYGSTLHINSVYNGRLGDSHRAEVPSPADIQVDTSKIKVLDESFMLHALNGTFIHRATLPGAEIEYRIYAHQALGPVLVNEIKISRKEGFTDEVTLPLTRKFNPKSDDVKLNVSPPSFSYHGWYGYGNTTISETAASPVTSVYMYWDVVPPSVNLSSGVDTQTWTFTSAISENKTDAWQAHLKAQSYVSQGLLYEYHAKAWRQKWVEGCIQLVGGSTYLGKAIYGSMYYILSSLPPLGAAGDFRFYGINPGGLAHGGTDPQGYKGHIFWDQETWMYPPITIFHPDLAVAMLKTRSNQLEAAKSNAAKNGFKGAQFPWEMGRTGAEVCPAEPYPTRELHINGDIAFAVQQYLWLTNDTRFLTDDRGFEMIKELAEFWASKVEYNESLQAYTINNIMPPDEYHQDVNNSVYTNTVAQISLRLPAYAASLLGSKVPEEWAKIADEMYIPFDEELQYHPEFEGYTPGTEVKQADTILLGFPLMANMTKAVRQNDLEMYETYRGANVTDPHGPAMTWGMFAIGWFELKNMTRAERLFAKSYANIQQPFKVWTETATGQGAVNFVTGMGGFLQAVVFGYGGMRLRQDRLCSDFELPPNATSLIFKGINYLSNSLNFNANSSTVSIELLIGNSVLQAPALKLIQGSDVHYFHNENPVVVPRAAFCLQPV